MSDFFDRFLKNNCKEEDFDVFLDLFLSETRKDELQERMLTDWENRESLESDMDFSPVLCNIHSKINEKEKVKSGLTVIVKYFSRIAAILIIPLVIALFYGLSTRSGEAFTQTVSTPLASRTSLLLPDGSKVWLNAGSSISFPSKFDRQNRVVKLLGQAYFDVKKDEVPFSVETRNFKVKVLGTAFDVLAYPGENAEVTLERGKVQLETSLNRKVELNPGQQAVINKTDGEVVKRNIDSKAFVSWKESRLTFDEVPLEKVVFCLERWFNVNITIEEASIKTLKVNGCIEYENIIEVLELLKITAPIEYTYDKEKQIFRLRAR